MTRLTSGWMRTHRGVLLYLVALAAVSQATAADPENCLLCHQFRGLSRYDPLADRVHVFFVDPDYTHDLAGAHARLPCTACHARAEVGTIPHQPVTRVDCTQVCHLAEPDGVQRRFSHAPIAELLERSVHSQTALTTLQFTGGPLLGPDQSHCLYCHDEPVFRSPANVVPLMAWAGGHAFDRCDVCHAEQIRVDTSYYLRHIASRLQPQRPPLEQAQVCAVCHTDPAVLRAAEMTDAVASFVRSFHGKAALLGDTAAASCTSCHVKAGQNAHLMLTRTDERASVHPRSLASACRSTQCHPGADPRLAAAAVHLDLPTARGTLEYAVAAAFILLTLATFGPSLVLCLLELVQIALARHHHEAREVEVLVERVLAHPDGPRRLVRFTVNQRVQHWVLAVLFAVLAVTGFPMKFADQGWARGVVDTLGGLAVTRTIHHWAGVALITGFVIHSVYCLVTLVQRARETGPAGQRRGWVRAVGELPMLVQPRDLRKAVDLLAYLVGLHRAPPTFGRFTIKEKFEYIGVFWGTTLLGLTGALLWGEGFFSHYFTGRVLNIALIAHTYEAFLAIIHVGILHIANVIFAPNVFPLSLATLTGQTPPRELAEQHSEYVAEVARELGILELETQTHE